MGCACAACGQDHRFVKTLKSSFGLFVQNFSDWICTVYHAHWQAPGRDLNKAYEYTGNLCLLLRKYMYNISNTCTVLLN